MNSFERLYVALLSECLHARIDGPPLPLLAAEAIDGDHSDEALLRLAALPEQAPFSELYEAARDVLVEHGVVLDSDTDPARELMVELLKMLSCHPSSAQEISAILRKIGGEDRRWAYLPLLGTLIGLSYTWDEPWRDELPELMSTEATRLLRDGL